MTFMMTSLFMLIVGVIIGYFFNSYVEKNSASSQLKIAELKASELIEKAKSKAEAEKKMAALEAKDFLFSAKQEFEISTRDRKTELQKLESRLQKKEENLDKKSNLLEDRDQDIKKKERNLLKKDKDLEKKHKDYNDLIKKQKETLEKISGLTAQEAKEILSNRMINDAKKESVILIKKLIEESKEKAEKEAKNIISYAIKRLASEQVAESTITVVPLPNDEMKGRIIGREGRNIRALEYATGIDLIIDDTPEAVILSGFDPIRREIASNALIKLITDGRIHPAKIEEVVKKAEKDILTNIRELGRQVSFEVGIHNLHPELIMLLGRLYYRTSYSQNNLIHSKEVAFIAGMIADELGCDSKIARRAGLLHDIGKAVDHEVQGPHAKIGADLARKYGEKQDVVHAIAAHHEDVEQRTLEAVLVQAADALSAARPGARREILESYIKRLEKLEAIADNFPGVHKAYAIQAGREVRIIVEPDHISDTDMIILTRDIAQKVEKELEYPGEIKVTAIRETRIVDYAK